MRRAEKKVADAEAEIAAIEKEISEVEAQIALGNIENAIFENHANLQKKLENAMSVWELANMELDGLSK